MARKTRKRPVSAAAAQFQPHDYVLAGLGAISLGRKQAADIYASGFQGMADWRASASHAVSAAASKVSRKALALHKRVQAEAAPTARKVAAIATEVGIQARSRLAPVLASFGLRKPVSRRTRAKRAG